MTCWGKAPTTGHNPPHSYSPSGPDRCFFVRTGYQECISTLPETTFALKSRAGRGPRISTEWQSSAKEEPALSFLDIPKEIRDMVYAEICGDLKREGYKWDQTAPPPEGKQQPEGKTDNDKTSDSKTKQAKRPSTSSDCAIMRTCKQVHVEFAKVMYSIPLQLSTASNGNNITPISPMYAHMVRMVLVMNPIYFRGWERTIAQFLQSVTSLSKIFPNLTVLRVGWWKLQRFQAEQTGWTVKDWEMLIKRMKKEANTPLHIPWNAELIELIGRKRGSITLAYECSEVENHVDADMAQAVKNMRSKPKKRKALAQS